MYHSITFTRTVLNQDGTVADRVSKNTYDDWKLVPKTRPVIDPPKVKTNYVDIPGSDGSIDLSEAVSPGPVYDNREGSWDFYVLNDYPTYKDWVDIYNKVMNFIHGFKIIVTLEDDPEYEYTGRLSVKDWKSQKDWSSITIDYILEPMKVHNDRTLEFDIDNENNVIELSSDVIGAHRAPITMSVTNEGEAYTLTFDAYSGLQDVQTFEIQTNGGTLPSPVIFGGGFAKLTFRSNPYLGRGAHVTITFKDARL